MSNWHLELTCPKCGGDFEFINGTRHGNEVGSLTVAIIFCPPCHSQYEVNVRLKPLAWSPQETNERLRAKAKGAK